MSDIIAGSDLDLAYRALLPDMAPVTWLTAKYTACKLAGRKGRGSVGGNAGVSTGKHTPHPDVHGFRRNGYKCEAKWNPAGAR